MLQHSAPVWSKEGEVDVRGNVTVDQLLDGLQLVNCRLNRSNRFRTFTLFVSLEEFTDRSGWYGNQGGAQRGVDEVGELKVTASSPGSILRLRASVTANRVLGNTLARLDASHHGIWVSRGEAHSQASNPSERYELAPFNSVEGTNNGSISRTHRDLDSIKC